MMSWVRGRGTLGRHLIHYILRRPLYKRALCWSGAGSRFISTEQLERRIDGSSLQDAGSEQWCWTFSWIATSWGFDLLIVLFFLFITVIMDTIICSQHTGNVMFWIVCRLSAAQAISMTTAGGKTSGIMHRKCLFLFLLFFYNNYIWRNDLNYPCWRGRTQKEQTH